MGALQLNLRDESALHYAAFISYAHIDEPKAAKLHRMLERYRPPRELKGKRHLLRPVFRDKDELTASHSLTDKIKDAVERSRKLIVLCSPAAKTSKWVNEEIRLFRARHGEDAILCALLEGTPETSFPPALTEEGREPLAADLTGKGEPFRLGMLQLAASMMDVGLNDLVRRESRRRRRVGSAVVLGALAFSGVMAASTLSAVKARQLAEDNRADAEDLVEFMISDLKFKLQPVGRLDILDGVGDKVMDYYSAQDIKDMPDDRIARQAKAMHLLGEVALDAGEYERAKTQLDAAYALTQEVLSRNPDDTDAIFAHAQSAYWVGRVFRDQNLYAQIRPYWQEYHDLGYQLYNMDKTEFDWIMEAAWAENNLGFIARMTSSPDQALNHYLKSIERFDEALKIKPKSMLALYEKVDVITGAEQLEIAEGNTRKAIILAAEGIETLGKIGVIQPKNNKLRAELAAKKSDMLWQHGFALTPQEREVHILEPLSELALSIEHDPENKKWRTDFIWHLYHSLVFSDNSATEREIFLALNKFRSEINFTELTNPQKFVLSFLMAKQNLSKGKNRQAYNNITDMEELLAKHQNLGASYNYFLANAYYDIGELKAAQKFAQNYLEFIKNEGKIKRPDSLIRIAEMESINGECEKARNKISSMLTMNADHAAPIAKIISCKT